MSSYDPIPSPEPLPTDPLFLRESDEIQGNILAGFNKDHQVFLFLQFADPDITLARGWLGELLPRIATTRQVSSFNFQFSDARKNRGGDDPTNLKALWVNVSFTHEGIQRLAPGHEAELAAFAAFLQGPAARASDLGDEGKSAPTQWLFGHPDREPVDVLLTVAADDETDLHVELGKQRALAAKYGLATLFEQRGETLSGSRRGHEHFGFKDGISQPGVRGFDPPSPDKPNEVKDKPGTDLIAAGEFVLGYPMQDGTTPDLPIWMRDGSFQVFRRLRQDVPGWWAQVTSVVESSTFADPPAEDRLAALLVGRWRSGTPLAQAPDHDDRSARNRQHDNDFVFDDDLEGFKTPRFAHIRKMYPRLESGPEEFPARERHRILRRGIPFGSAFDPAAGRGHGVDASRGLCFNAYMASVDEQFEFLQRQWANNPNFFKGGDGPDPIIGISPEATCTFHREGQVDQELTLTRFVFTEGAVYAFAPSCTALERMVKGDL